MKHKKDTCIRFRYSKDTLNMRVVYDGQLFARGIQTRKGE